MKKGKLLLVSLASVLLLSACNQGKKDDGKEGGGEGKETVAVESVSLNKQSLSLRVGGFEKLIATVAPEKAANKGVSWSSSDATIASVDQEGKVSAKAAGNAVITVTTTDGNKTATCNVEVKEALINAELTGLSVPEFYKNGYAKNIQNLDTWVNLPNRTDIDYNTYFKGIDEEGHEVDGADPYKVGSQNPFVFHVTGEELDNETLEDELIENPFIKVLLEIKGTNGFEEVSEPSQYVEMSGTTTIDTFKFKTDAIGKQFKLTFAGDDSRYESVTAKPVSIIIEVVNGYNITTPEELVLMDNRDLWNNLDSEAADPWGEVRQGLKSANKYPTNINDVKGIVLHNSFSIDSDFLPASLKYSEAQINDYISSYGSDFTGWIKAKNTSRAEDDRYDADSAKALLIGSTRDWASLFYRTTIKDEDFVFEGNYNSIDFSGIKQIFSFQGAKLEDGKLSQYQSTNSSHAQIFGFNYETQKKDDSPADQRGGTVTFNNVTFRGNGKYSSDDNYMGGLMTFKVESTDAYFNNIITYDTFMSFMTNAARQEPETTMTIDRCKSYGSYNSMCYTWGVERNIVKNSYFEKAGGALFLMDNVDYDKKTSDFHRPGSFDTENCRLHNLATGLEPWFVQFGATAILNVVKAMGIDTGYLGATAKKLSSVNKKYKTTLDFVMDGNTPVPVANIIAINMTVDNPLGNNTETGMTLDGHFSVNNGKRFAVDMHAFENSQMTDPTAAYFRPDFVTYRNQINAAGAQGFVLETDAGGSSFMTALDETTFATNGASMIPEFLTPVGDAQLDLSAYALMTYLSDSRFGEGQVSLVGSDNVTYPIDAVIAQQTSGLYANEFGADAAKRMVSGDYAGLYIKPNPAANGCYLGVMLGLTEIPDAWLAA